MLNRTPLAASMRTLLVTSLLILAATHAWAQAWSTAPAEIDPYDDDPRLHFVPPGQAAKAMAGVHLTTLTDGSAVLTNPARLRSMSVGQLGILFDFTRLSRSLSATAPIDAVTHSGAAGTVELSGAFSLDSLSVPISVGGCIGLPLRQAYIPESLVDRPLGAWGLGMAWTVPRVPLPVQLGFGFDSYGRTEFGLDALIWQRENRAVQLAVAHRSKATLPIHHIEKWVDAGDGTQTLIEVNDTSRVELPQVWSVGAAVHERGTALHLGIEHYALAHRQNLNQRREYTASQSGDLLMWRVGVEQDLPVLLPDLRLLAGFAREEMAIAHETDGAPIHLTRVSIGLHALGWLQVGYTWVGFERWRSDGEGRYWKETATGGGVHVGLSARY